MCIRDSLAAAPSGCVAGDHVVQDEVEDPMVLKVLRLQRANVTFKVRELGAVVDSTSSLYHVSVGSGNRR